MQLVRLALRQPDEDQSRHVREFAAPNLDEALAKAMDWNADRANHGLTPTLDAWLVERWDGTAWVELDLA